MGAIKEQINDILEMLEDTNMDFDVVAKYFGMTPREVYDIACDYSEYFDDSMDGDHDSAMASAGFGTDEDYGYYGDE
jgi:hypothetical protein